MLGDEQEGFWIWGPRRTLWQVANSTGSPSRAVLMPRQEEGLLPRTRNCAKIHIFPSFPRAHPRARFYLPPAPLTEPASRECPPAPRAGLRGRSGHCCPWEVFTRPGPPPVCVHKVLLQCSHACEFLQGPWPCSLGNGRGEQLWQKLYGPSSVKYSLLAL